MPSGPADRRFSNRICPRCSPHQPANEMQPKPIPWNQERGCSRSALSARRAGGVCGCDRKDQRRKPGNRAGWVGSSEGGRSGVEPPGQGSRTGSHSSSSSHRPSLGDEAAGLALDDAPGARMVFPASYRASPPGTSIFSRQSDISMAHFSPGYGQDASAPREIIFFLFAIQSAKRPSGPVQMTGRWGG